MELNEISYKIVGAAIEVHKELGPGLFESVYESCLVEELKQAGLKVQRQVFVNIVYKGKKLDQHYVIDLLVEDTVIVELKSVEMIYKLYEAQLLTYLKLSGKKLGLLINFNEVILINGIRRVIN
jgi:GxxExxY protein